MGLEAGASEIFTFQTTLVPGLLQTSGYVEMINRDAGMVDDAELKRHIDARTQRQMILMRPSTCRFHALIDENALLRISDPQVRSEQIRHLIKVSERPNVEVQVLKIADGVYPGTSEPFVYLKFPGPLTETSSTSKPRSTTA